MSEEQILAKMAGNSPEAAQALSEIRRAAIEGTLSVEQKAMYERLLQQQEQVTSVWREGTDRLERMRHNDTLDRQAERDSTRNFIETQLRGMAEIERAKTQPATTSPNIILTGSGTTPPSSGYYPAQQWREDDYGGNLCAKCGHQNQDNAKFCGECGEPLLED